MKKRKLRGFLTVLITCFFIMGSITVRAEKISPIGSAQTIDAADTQNGEESDTNGEAVPELSGDADSSEPTLLDDPDYVLGKECRGKVIGFASAGEPVVLPRSTVGALATITPGPHHAYGSWGTTEFTVKSAAGTFSGYCAQPNSTTPSGTFKISQLNNDTIKALLLLAPGGAMYSESFWNTYGQNPATGGIDGNDAISLAHACIGYAYEGTTTGLSATDISELNAYINDARGLIGTADFKKYTAYVAYNSAQDIVWVEKTPTGKVTLSKSSSNPAVTANNSCYSLEGATYGVYSDSGCSKSVGTLTTKADGKSNEIELDTGDYWVKETLAPSGFALDKKAYKVKVTSGQTNTLKLSDIPTMNPLGVLLGKKDAETNQNKPQGSASLGGALFQVKFYGGHYDADPAGQGKTALRSWVFRTDNNGFCNYSTQYLESGDELYKSASDATALPLGTVTIQETKPPKGYLLNPEVYVVKITSNNDGSETVSTYHEVTVPENVLKLDVVKKEKGTQKAIPGTVFQHTLPDKRVEQATADANGKVTFKGLTWGTHVIEESSVPDGYTRNPGKVTFSVSQDNKITVLSNTATITNGKMTFTVKGNGCALLEAEDTLAPYKLLLHKRNESEKKLQGAVFTVYSDKGCQNVVAKSTTGEDGMAEFADLTVGTTYYLKESKAPTGYRIPVNADGSEIIYEIRTSSDPLSNTFEYYVNGQKHTENNGIYAITGTKANREVNLTVVNHTGVKMPETGSPLTLGIFLAGICFMAGALVYHNMNKKRGKKDENEE